MPLAIVHVARRFAPLRGGTERYIHDVAQAQAEEGHRVQVLTLDRDVIGTVRGRLAAREVLDRVQITRLPGVGGARFAATWHLRRAAHTIGRADVVHVHDIRFLFVASLLMARAARRPVLFHTHGLIFHTPWATPLKTAAMRLVIGPLLHAARAQVIAGSLPDRAQLLSHAPYLASRTQLFENAIDLSAHFAMTRQPHSGLLVCLGRVARSKGIDRLLRALSRVTHASWRLEIIGPDESGEADRLARLASDLGVRERVVIRGAMDDEALRLALSRAAGAVFPSRGEGFGLALLEAMASGVPVLASDLDAHASVLGDALAERLVDFEDAPAATRALSNLLSLDQDEGVRLGRAERDRAASFHITRLWRQISTLYGDLGLSG